MSIVAILSELTLEYIRDPPRSPMPQLPQEELKRYGNIGYADPGPVWYELRYFKRGTYLEFSPNCYRRSIVCSGDIGI